MRCGWRWPPMTRCCARRSKRMAASCSSTPATGCAPRSSRPDSRLMPLSLPRLRWNCRCGWALRPERQSCAAGTTSERYSTVSARVMAAGHGGQILLADSTAVLVSGVDLVDLGPRRLRDLPIPLGMFQVRAPGLRTNFPPLRALDVSPGNLRPAVTSFIGRDSEVAEVQAAVRTHRLVTLTGVGGVGKTRLATEVAGAARRRISRRRLVF